MQRVVLLSSEGISCGRTREKEREALRMGDSPMGAAESASGRAREMKAIDFLRAASISSTTSPTALQGCQNLLELSSQPCMHATSFLHPPA